MVSMVRFAVAMLLAPAAFGQDAALGDLRSALTALRPHRDEHRETRGATAALTGVKHQLRDWVESRLAGFPQTGDAGALEQQLHAALRDAKLLCEGDCFKLNSVLGYLDEIRVRREQEFLVIQTSTGIWCGYDDSAYVFQWSTDRDTGGWQRLWVAEQNTYTEKEYLPQALFAVHISEPDAQGRRLLLTLGAKPGCSAAFLPVYYRAFQLSGSASKLLLDGAQLASMAGFPPIKGQVSPEGVMLEFTAGGTGYGFGHQAVRHYELRDGKLQQIDPLAPSPRDFVEEWLSAPWTQSAALAESQSLEAWHRKFHREDGMGDFPDPTLRCSNDPQLWQVGIRWHDTPGETFYKVRWRQPYRFSMVEIADHPDPGCTEPDSDADRHRTFFP
jgi:hypothetical protein